MHISGLVDASPTAQGYTHIYIYIYTGKLKGEHVLVSKKNHIVLAGSCYQIGKGYPCNLLIGR